MVRSSWRKDTEACDPWTPEVTCGWRASLAAVFEENVCDVGMLEEERRDGVFCKKA